MVATKTLQLFARLGYNKVSFQDIAKATGVPRTAIYRYYHTKRDIFDATIIEEILKIRQAISKIVGEQLTASERLEKVCFLIADRLHEQRDFIKVIFNFVFAMIECGEDMSGKVQSFTSGLKKTFRELIDEGVEDGSIRAQSDAELISEMLFSIVESSALKMLVGIETDSASAKCRMGAVIDVIVCRP